MPLYAGVSETNITPPPDVWMSGYAFRSTPAIGIHDELSARALVLDNGTTRLGIVAMDLIALDFELVDRIRAGVTAQAGIPGEALLLNATHTHGGPGSRTFRTMGPTDPVYREILVRKIIGAVMQAARDLRPGRVAYGSAPCQIGVNRRPIYPEGRAKGGFSYAGPAAPTVQALRIENASGAPVALLFLHACHPVTLGGGNLLITADWCGYACRTVQEAVRDVVPFCLQGCAGNINPIRGGTFADAEDNGRQVGQAALEAMAQAQPLEGGELVFTETTVALPLLLPDREYELRRAEEFEAQRVQAEQDGAPRGRLLFLEDRRDCARDRAAVASQPDPDLSQPFRIQRLTVCGAHLLGLPAEMFVQYQNDFTAQCRQPVFATAFTNGCHGYVPTAADYPYGGYEVEDAFHYYGTLMVSAGCERLIRDEVYRLLRLDNLDRTPYTVFAE